jgi:hypothetical protein
MRAACRLILSFSLFLCAAACREKAADVRPTTEPTAKIVYVVVTATPAPQKEDAVLAAAIREKEMASYAAAHTPPTPRAYLVAPPTAARAASEPVPFCEITDFVTRLPDSDGDIWFAGDVINLGATPAKVLILVKAYTVNERLLDSKTVYPAPEPIPAGARGHFESFVRANGDTIRKVIPEVLPR